MVADVWLVMVVPVAPFAAQIVPPVPVLRIFPALSIPTPVAAASTEIVLKLAWITPVLLKVILSVKVAVHFPVNEAVIFNAVPVQPGNVPVKAVA